MKEKSLRAKALSYSFGCSWQAARRFALRWKMSRVASRAEIVAAEKHGYRQTVELRGPR
jgi:hypothetical protein